MSQINFYFILEALSQIWAIKDSLSSNILLILDATDFRFIRHSENKNFIILVLSSRQTTVPDMK
jgi:hypothetical protein